MEMNHSIEYHNLGFLKNRSEEISERGGVYYWVYYPNIDNDSDLENYKSSLLEYSKKQLLNSEISSGFKFTVSVKESGFSSRNPQNLFGLSDKKHQSFENYLTSMANRTYFTNFFKEACFQRPFYIGKANNLRNRLSQHFSRDTYILPNIDDADIPHNHIWIGWQETDSEVDTNINIILEEIAQRIIKPQLTIKAG